MIYDGLRHRYFKIDEATAGLLSLWPSHATIGGLVAAARTELGLAVDEREVEALRHFLVGNHLVVPQSEQDWRGLLGHERRGRHSPLMYLVHNYLFVRLPLFDPQPLLARLVPATAPLFSRAAAFVVVALGVAGLYLVSRQWDVFLATLPGLLSLEGLLLSALSIAFVKTLHELGHAIVAARHGCRVPSMGLCLMVLMPILYTEVSDAWRRRSRRQRLAIGAAGLIVETAVACIATFLWAFLPDGPVRSLVFTLATTSWIMSLALNLNPFMRFDGYHILADATGMDNLQPRAFAMGRWWLREKLFALGSPPPEHMPRGRTRLLVLYAYATWAYRLVVFIGIALLVYYLTFKLLGLALFVIEIAFFIALPIWREIKEWHRMRARIFAQRRTYVTLAALIMFVVSAFVPWSSRIMIPAIAEDQQLHQVYPKRPARVEAVHVLRGDWVEAGQRLVELVSPELDSEIERTRLSMRAVSLRLSRRTADLKDRAESFVLEDSLYSLRSRLAGLEAERAELVITAAEAGHVAELAPQLQPGRWVQRTDLVAIIAGGQRRIVRGYVGELDVARLDMKAPSRFIPELALMPSLAVELRHIAMVGTDAMDIPALSTHYGGGVAARSQQRGNQQRVQVTAGGQFLVTGLIDDAAAPRAERVIRGTVHAAGLAESIAARVWRQVLKVLIRESGV